MSAVKCGHCDEPLSTSAPPGGSGRRVTRFLDCTCGATTQVMSHEGRRRWYRVAWRASDAQPWQHDDIADERARFYALKEQR